MQISILGCGWLGLSLAENLIQKEFLVKGSTTSESKVPQLEKAGIETFQINLGSLEIQGSIKEFLRNSEVLIINIPPKLRSENADSFVDKMQRLIPYIEKSSVEKVVFVSSTSVYGKSNLEGIVTEKVMQQPDTESGKQLLIVENLLQKNKNFKTSILRFGGLIGEDRNPITVLVKKERNEDADAPVNLIHRKDCIAIISEIIHQNCWGEVFNAVAPFHPSRKEYYTKKAIELNLAKPKFYKKKTMPYKIISSSRLEHILDYNFQEI